MGENTIIDCLLEMVDTFPCDHIVTFKPKSCCVCRAIEALRKAGAL